MMAKSRMQRPAPPSFSIFVFQESMAKPNYQYEKRQKDLAKQRKKQEKEQEKALRKASKVTGVEGESGDAAAVAAPPDVTDQKSED